MSTDFTPLACSAGSRASAEPIYATIKPARFWLMFEHDAAYGAKALLQSSLPEAVKARLNHFAAGLQSSRVLLIRQQPRQVTDGLRLFLAVTDELQPALYAFELQTDMDLLELDLSSADGIARQYAAFRQTDPLFLVCTNGRRDPCCAAYGLPVYNRLAEIDGAAVWQTSHLGGHRFAANMACMPHGLFYGRVDPETAPGLLAAYQRQELVTASYRGRACYPKTVQAAEYFLRMDLQLAALGQLRFLDETRQDADVHQVRFEVAGEPSARTVRLRVLPEGNRVLISCQDEQPGTSPAYQLLEIH